MHMALNERTYSEDVHHVHVNTVNKNMEVR